MSASLTLFLQSSEQAIFDQLNDSLKEGWSVEEETLNTYERPEELAMRYQMAQFDDPAIKKFAGETNAAKTEEELQKIVEVFDLENIPQEQSAEIFFMLGTKVLSKIITYLLEKTENDEDIEGIAGLTHIRHMLLETNSSS